MLIKFHIYVLLKNASAEYRVDLDLQMSYASIFEYNAVRLVRIIIK